MGGEVLKNENIRGEKPREKVGSPEWLADLRSDIVCETFHKYVSVAVEFAKNTDTASLIAAVLTLADELHAIDITLGSK